MPRKRDHTDLTPDDLDAICDMAIQETHGRKAVDKGSLALNIEAIEKRITHLKSELEFMATCPLSESDPELCAEMMIQTRRALRDAELDLASLKALDKQRN